MKVLAILTILAVAVYAQRDRHHKPSKPNRPNRPNHHNVIEGRGQIWCGQFPASGVMVQLWAENTQSGPFGSDSFLGSTRTSSSGNFIIRTNKRPTRFQNRYIIIQHTCGSRHIQMARFPMFPDQMIRVQLKVSSTHPPRPQPPFFPVPVATAAAGSN